MLSILISLKCFSLVNSLVSKIDQVVKQDCNCIWHQVNGCFMCRIKTQLARVVCTNSYTLFPRYLKLCKPIQQSIDAEELSVIL